MTGNVGTRSFSIAGVTLYQLDYTEHQLNVEAMPVYNDLMGPGRPMVSMVVGCAFFVFRSFKMYGAPLVTNRHILGYPKLNNLGEKTEKKIENLARARPIRPFARTQFS